MTLAHMEQQLIADELAATGAQELLTATSAHLAYNAQDGSPRVVPVGVFWTGTEFEKSCREMYDQMARIAIVPTWVRFYDFGAGRMPKFLTELSERNRS